MAEDAVTDALVDHFHRVCKMLHNAFEKFTEETYEGSVRALHNWIALDGSDFLGVGTNLKFYIECLPHQCQGLKLNPHLLQHHLLYFSILQLS